MSARRRPARRRTASAHTARAHTAPARTALPAGLLAAAGAALLVIAAFLTWLRMPTVDGGTTTIGGFGAIGGDPAAAGENLNEMLAIAGLGSYRPGLVGLLAGLIGLPAAVVLAVRRPTTGRPFRACGVLLAVVGAVSAGWAGYRWIDPGSGGGVLQSGDAGAGAGTWLTALGGLLALGAACWVLAGRADPAVADPRPPRRGIQPGR